MRYIAVFLGLTIMLAGCLQQRSAPIDERGAQFFGKDANYDLHGNELPRYSNSNPADMPADQDAKYVQDNSQTYGVSAEIEPIAASDLPPVETTTVSNPMVTPQNAVNTAVSDTQLAAQQAADKAAAEARLASEQLAASTQAIASPPISNPPTASASTALLPKGWATDGSSVTNAAADEASMSAAKELNEIKTSAAMAAPPQAPSTFLWPLKGELLKDFTASGGEGIAIAGRSGEPIRATADGVVAQAGEKLAGYGIMVIVKHAGGYVSTYAHLSDAVVSVGDNVIAGQLIGFVGKTGNVTAPQLQFTLHSGTKAVDPVTVLK
jgi:murein DD-endopeptidase MepM/ murein hydrolase activator NlpD